MIDIYGNSQRLRDLKTGNKTPVAVEYVHDMLASKFEGLQSGAIQVLASWGQADDKALILKYLLHTYDRRPDYGSIRGVVVSALGPLITQEDAAWLMDLCFAQKKRDNRHELLPLFARLQPKTTRTVLVKHLSSASPLDRWTAVRAITLIGFPDQKRLLEPLSKDTDKEVRGAAATGIKLAAFPMREVRH